MSNLDLRVVLVGLDSIVHGCAPYFIFVGIEFRMNCGFGSGLVTFHLNLCTRFVLDMQTSMVSESVRIILPRLWTHVCFLFLVPVVLIVTDWLFYSEFLGLEFVQGK